jgi:two-component system, LytTR family, sensor kinase
MYLVNSPLRLFRSGESGPRQPLHRAFLTPRAGRLAVGAAAWVLVGVLDGVESYYKRVGTLYEMTAGQAVAAGLLLWGGWMLVGLVVFAAARYYPLVGPHWPRRAAAYLAAGCVCVLAKLLFDWPIAVVFFCPGIEERPLAEYFRGLLPTYGFRYYLIYWGLVGIGHALNSFRQLGDRERRAVQLEGKLAAAQLQMLRLQLHPHFLLNTLNAISALIHKDVEVADRMVAQLGDLLRLLLDRFGAAEVTLEEELEFLNRYLEIEQERHGARLRVREQVEAGLQRAWLPPLILQPLVENAVKHGIGPGKKGGRITVRARRDRKQGRLRLEVEDNGVGLAPDYRPGVGLSNTYARLRQLYPGAFRFELRAGAGGGTLAVLELPFRTKLHAGHDEPQPASAE